MEYDVIVVGGGHAGCEAALASSRMGNKTLLITGNINNIADMPCNPSIGGSAKGIVVREIDALGGEMGRNADKSKLQIKMLNSSKGPSVQALRAQADKITYPKEMLKTLKSVTNLEIKEDLVENLIVRENTVEGVELENGEKILNDPYGPTWFKPGPTLLIHDNEALKLVNTSFPSIEIIKAHSKNIIIYKAK